MLGTSISEPACSVKTLSGNPLERARRALAALQGTIPDAEWTAGYADFLQLQLDAQQQRYEAALGVQVYQYLANAETTYPLAVRCLGGAA